jgi:hypothetical protein
MSCGCCWLGYLFIGLEDDIIKYLCSVHSKQCGTLDAISVSCAGEKQFYPGLGELC